MKIKASPLEGSEFEGRLCDVAEFSLAPSGLRIVLLFPNEDVDLYQEIFFPDPRGFRYLDEGDLIRYWKSGEFSDQAYSVFQILAGGWMDQELQTGEMLTTTEAVGWYREWFVMSSNGCINVIAKDPPLIRRL